MNKNLVKYFIVLSVTLFSFASYGWEVHTVYPEFVVHPDNPYPLGNPYVDDPIYDTHYVQATEQPIVPYEKQSYHNPLYSYGDTNTSDNSIDATTGTLIGMGFVFWIVSGLFALIFNPITLLVVIVLLIASRLA